MFVGAGAMLQCGQHNRSDGLSIVEGMGIAELIGGQLGACQTLGWQALHDGVRLLQQLVCGLRVLFGHPLEQADG